MFLAQVLELLDKRGVKVLDYVNMCLEYSFNEPIVADMEM